MSRDRITRRGFIKASAATAVVAGFPTIVPSSVLGKTAPSNTVTLAAIGVEERGFGDCWHNFAPAKDMKFIAVADCFVSRRNKFAQLYNKKYGSEVCKTYVDFHEVLARPDVDGVVVSTPDHQHVPIAWAAAMAGKDMYVEKPLSVAMAWSQKLREAGSKKDVIFQYGTQQRSMRSSQLATDLVRNGHIGTIERIDVWAPGGPAHWGKPGSAAVPADLVYRPDTCDPLKRVVMVAAGHRPLHRRPAKTAEHRCGAARREVLPRHRRRHAEPHDEAR